MKIIIFAGGAGTRLWPLSRQSFPKQFIQMFSEGGKNGKSTLQLAVERIEETFGYENIYISTNKNYVSLVKEQLPQIPSENVISEPQKRNLAPAVGYNFIRLRKLGYKGPVAILWADHLMERPKNFLSILKKGEELIKSDPKRLIFVGERARYPENNLGWIHIGKEKEPGLYEFVEWIYKPPLDKCRSMFESGEWKWNPGYFIVDLNFVLNLYQEFQPKIYDKLTLIEKAVGTSKETKVMDKIYPQMESVSFDSAIIEKVPSDKAVVLAADMGWSDPGTLYALKEALANSKEENVTKGLVAVKDTYDSLIINNVNDKLVVTLGLNGIIVINTDDATLVVPKEKVLNLSELVKELEQDPTTKKYT